MKPNPDDGVEILHKNVTEGPQKHFDTTAKYITNDVFVSVTASHSSQS